MPSIVFGSVSEYTSWAAQTTQACMINDSTFIVCYIRQSDNTVWGSVYRLVGTTLTELKSQQLWAGAVHAAGASYRIDCCKVTDNIWTVVYIDPAIPDRFQVRLLSWDGGTSTITDHGQQYGGAIDPIADVACCQTADNKVIYFMRHVTNTEGIGVIATQAGNSLTFGVTSVFNTDTVTYIFGSGRGEDTHKFAMIYNDTVAGITKIQGGSTPTSYDAAGRVLSYGSTVQVYGATTGVYNNLCCLDDDKIIVTLDARTVSKARLRAVTFDASDDPTVGANCEFLANQVRANACCKINTTSGVVAFADNGDADKGKTIPFTVDWGTLVVTDYSAQTFETGPVGGGTDRAFDIIQFDTNTVAIVFQDDGDGDKGKAIAGDAYFLPGIVTSPTCTPGILKNTISWGDAVEATSHNIYWGLTSGVTILNGTKITGVTSPYEHGSLSPGVPYYYIITGENSFGEGSASAQLSGIPILEAPSGLIIVEELGRMYFSWEDTAGATSYNLYYDTNPGVTKSTGTKVTGITSPYSFYGLTEGITYYFVVTAQNGSSESGESSEVSGIFWGTMSVSARPENRRIFIKWEDVPSAISYNIYWIQAPSEGAFDAGFNDGFDKIYRTTTFTKLEGVSYPYAHQWLVPDNTYCYFMSYVSTSGESPYSSIQCVLLSSDIPYGNQNISLLPKGFVFGR